MAYTAKSIERLMKKYDFSGEDISYILRDESKTIIHLLEGREITSLIPIGHFESYLPQGEYERVNKDVLLCKNQVVNVNRGVYLMTDGAELDGRHHGTKCHTDFMRRMIEEQSSSEDLKKIKELQEEYAAYDELPLPFCVIQLVFDVYGRGTTFIFRYVNKMMEVLENRSMDELLNHSFYEIFEDADETWLVKYGDLAKNGGRRIFREYRPEVGKNLTIVSYQAAPGYCACLLLEEDWLDKLEKLDKMGKNMPKA